MSRIVVSLTTVPSRVASLHRTLDSLHRQDLVPDAIELNIPRQYSRRDMGHIAAADLPKGCALFLQDEDLGPATKVLPTVARYRGQDVMIVYCDDDHEYDPGWLRRLVSVAQRHPEAVVAESCVSSRRWETQLRWKRKGPLYRAGRAASLGMWKPMRRDHHHCDVAEGLGGVLIRPHFIDAVGFDIPGPHWAVDDVWLSGICQKNGHDVLSTRGRSDLGARPVQVAGEWLHHVDALCEMTVEGQTRLQSNVDCIRYMRRRFGVFAGPRFVAGRPGAKALARGAPHEDMLRGRREV